MSDAEQGSAGGGDRGRRDGGVGGWVGECVWVGGVAS